LYQVAHWGEYSHLSDLQFGWGEETPQDIGCREPVGDAQVIAAAPDLRQVGVTELDLSSQPITDRAVPSIITIKSLEYLHLSGTDVTMNGLRQLAALPNLKELYISKSPYTADDVLSLSKLLSHTVIVGDSEADRRRHEGELTQGQVAAALSRPGALIAATDQSRLYQICDTVGWGNETKDLYAVRGIVKSVTSDRNNVFVTIEFEGTEDIQLDDGSWERRGFVARYSVVLLSDAMDKMVGRLASKDLPGKTVTVVGKIMAFGNPMMVLHGSDQLIVEDGAGAEDLPLK
jgi:hypothetical protein